MSICCHYDEGYEDGLDAAKTDGMGEGLSNDCADLLERVAEALYAVDPLSMIALECQQLRKEIRECLRPGARL